MNPRLLLLLCAALVWYTTLPAMGNTLEVRVVHNDDDAEEDDGDPETDNDEMELGPMNWAGFRFLNVTIPQGATITSAYVQFKAADSNTESTDLTVFGQDADSTSRFNENVNNLSSRPRTSASADWSNVPNWSINQFYQTPDITAVIQEIIDRGGWSSGSSMVILVRSDDLDGERLVVAHDDSPSNAALLHIEYSIGSCSFADVSGTLGFNLQTTTSATTGSGLHWADYDNDGDLDVIITGNNAARLLLSVNEGASFGAATFAGGNHASQGAMVDIDNDGDIDFWHRDEILNQNDGSAVFADSGNLGFGDPATNEAVAAADVNNDGYCDIVMFSGNGNWIGHHQSKVAENLLGTDAATYGLNGVGDSGTGEFCSSGDVNADGYLDFFYHYGTGKLFLSGGDGTYTENAGGISVVTGSSDRSGSAWADYDNDGDLDLFVPRNASGQRGYLWKNTAGTFSDVSVAAGVTDTSAQTGCCWGDYDNDGDLDLYICTASGDNVLYQNQGNGTFLMANECVEANGNSHDAVFVDYDNDGDLDLAVTKQGTTNVLLQNGTNGDSYLKVRVIGHGINMTNMAAIGVRVELYEADATTFIARREIGVARGYGGTEPLWIHFGGVIKSDTYVIKVYFVSGVQAVTVVPQSVSTTIGSTVINQMLTVQERKPRVFRWKEIRSIPS